MSDEEIEKVFDAYYQMFGEDMPMTRFLGVEDAVEAGRAALKSGKAVDLTPPEGAN